LQFEGPEKKLEIYSQSAKFLTYPISFWEKLVELCGARILSHIKNPTSIAFLLSESSLFVWDHKILMITCGRTELIKSAEFMTQHLGLKNIDHFFFERKNEYFPEYQRSFVFDDFKLLKNLFPEGYGLKFGDKDDHHLYLFEYSQKSTVPDQEKNLEALMYGVTPEISDLFLNPTSENKNKLSSLIKNFFPKFQIDDYWFDPCGYSMNALLDNSYGTIHVTPEKEENYISFEMNNIEPHQVESFLNLINNTFAPRSCDIIYFNPTSKNPLDINMKSWTKRQSRFEVLKSGYGVTYIHWSESNIKAQNAEIMEIE
jgi:S-adenosylmethionine decarboxylase